MPPKIKPSTALVTIVALYGGYRLVKSAQNRRALAAAPSRLALPGGARQALPPGTHPQNSTVFTNPVRQVVDWREAGTPEGIQSALQRALDQDGDRINSSNELVYAVGNELWPGLSIHQTGVDAVRAYVRKAIVFDGAPDTDENHEAAVRMTARLDRTLVQALEVYDGTIPTSVVQDTVASSIFPERAWPPQEDAPAWTLEVWRRVGLMVEGALRVQGRLPTEVEAAPVPDQVEVTASTGDVEPAEFVPAEVVVKGGDLEPAEVSETEAADSSSEELVPEAG